MFEVKALIFDISDVFWNSVPPQTTCISPDLFQNLYATTAWYEYNCGRIGQDECFERLADIGKVSVHDIARTVELARSSRVKKEQMVSVIRELRIKYPNLRVYAMSNMSRPDWEALKLQSFAWDIFDDIFASWESGMCKPELRFYHLVLERTEIAPKEALFVDSDLENTLAAKSLGFHTFTLDSSAANIRRQLLNILLSPSQRGSEWLLQNSNRVWSESDTGLILPDNFSQLLIYELTGDLGPLNLKYSARTWNYFIEIPWNTIGTHPDDLDTTSYAMRLLPHNRELVDTTMDEMVEAKNTTADGIVKVYFDKDRRRVDPTVCVNVVRLFYHHGRGNDPLLEPTKRWVRDVLLHRAYLGGTRYYQTPEAFLYFFAHLLSEIAALGATDESFHDTIPLLSRRLRERLNADGDALAVGMRMLACHFVGVPHDEPALVADMRRLLDMQQEDGSFEVGWLCRYGKSKIRVGNRALTTIVAVRVIETFQRK